MWRELLLVAWSVQVAYEVSKLLEQRSRRLMKKRAKICWDVGGEDRISALPDDLLVHILMFLPTKKVVATMILSKRWRFIWTMVPQLFYKEINHVTRKGFLGGLLDRLFGKQKRSVWRFLDESLQAHKAPILEKLVIELGPQCPIDVDVGKWIANAVERRVRVLSFELMWSAMPIRLPKSVYTCHTLYHLYLFDKILVDVPSPACLPSLQYLSIYSVVYKDEDSHVRLLSSCPNLKVLVVGRHHQDNVTNFIIKVPTLECLFYDSVELGALPNGSLVIDSPRIKRIFIRDYSGGSCSIENEPRFDKALIYVCCYPDNKFMRSLSSIICLELLLEVPTVACCNSINFSRLLECRIILQDVLDWLEPLMLLLQNSSILKVLLIHKVTDKHLLPLSWNQPSSVPGCLSSHLEIFEWKEYGGRSEEKEVVRYIFANSKCLKRAGIAMKSTRNPKDKKKMMVELESMSRVSTSSQLLFSTQFGRMDY
ncbi:putative F-box/FBD/LRR-repeat protein [Cardamine amara subsp. amara]|uniref:F-box/FBD/LRR-repeat protein n=1 Tax=Cardamine amara subsp. amara TaxID=228776 RepID=A0ABD1BVZ5_CARAN